MVAEGCVSCHNSHPDTPKNDWKLGDVRGVLEVTMPIDDSLAAFKQSSLKSGGIVALAIGIIVLAALFCIRRVFEAQKTFSRKFQDDILSLSNGFGDLSRTIESKSSTVFDSSERTKIDADNVRATSSEASANMQTVGSAAEELTASIQEITRRTAVAREKSTAASRKAQSSTDLVNRLAEASSEIGEIVSVINSIAEQTNLLALNATIESARAGDAGKGFAVVANKVKELANQTTIATADISKRINEVQESAASSANSIREIHTEVSELEQISVSVATTVEQQQCAVNEIARNIANASTGTQNVADKIANVSNLANSTSELSSEMLTESQKLSGETRRLQSAVDGYLQSMGNG
jgi:methyl-accepting chemotaxis protein